MSSLRNVVKLGLIGCLSGAALGGCGAIQKGGEAMPGGIGQLFKVEGAAVSELQKEQDDKSKAILTAQVATENIDSLMAIARTSLSQDLPNVPEVKASDTQKILAFGPFVNLSPELVSPQTATIKLEELRTGLAGSEAIKASYVVVDRSDTSLEAIKNQVTGAGNDPSKLAVFDDPAQRKPSATGATIYNPNDIYVLSAQFGAVDNGSTLSKDDAKNRQITYSLLVKMLHANSGAVVVARDYVAKYKWDDDKKSFVPAA